VVRGGLAGAWARCQAALAMGIGCNWRLALLDLSLDGDRQVRTVSGALLPHAPRRLAPSSTSPAGRLQSVLAALVV
jgi:hypothetical protein